MTLRVENLRLSYGHGAGRHLAVDGVSFALGKGQIGALIGPSGCGKTSVLRCIAGLEAPSSGIVRLHGEAISTPDHVVPPERRRIGMVFQDYALFPHLSVAANVAFGLGAMPSAQQRARVSEVLSLVGLPHTEARMPHELSGGQQQRVALARALAPQPEVLLLDEPFSSLDAAMREQIAHELLSILKTADITTLMVTHDQHEAFAMADVIGVMNAGQLHQWADAYTVYHQPDTPFVASVIGHSLLLPATLNGSLVSSPLGQFTTTRLCSTQSTPVNLLLRADDIVPDAASPLTAEVVQRAFRGNVYLCDLKLPNGQQVQAYVPSHEPCAVGSHIGIRAELDHVIVFDR